jgi:hypothetical protein
VERGGRAQQLSRGQKRTPRSTSSEYDSHFADASEPYGTFGK